jgi:hypothetical protein
MSRAFLFLLGDSGLSPPAHADGVVGNIGDTLYKTL